MTLNREFTNKLVVRIDSAPNAGSSTDHIYLKFGTPRWLPGGGSMWNLKMNGTFDKSTTLTCDFNESELTSFFDTMPTDHWDHVRLETSSYDGIAIAQIILVHSGEEILNLDFNPSYMLDKPPGTIIDLSYYILNHKRSVLNTHYPVISYAAEELGKTDGYKYGLDPLWCSEFAAWCLKKGGGGEYMNILPPNKKIGSGHLVDFFEKINRLARGSDVTDGKYTLHEGDYLQLNGGKHSGLFYRYISRQNGSVIQAPHSPTQNTWIRCIEGNVADPDDKGPGAVRVVDRQLKSVDNVGKTVSWWER